MKTQMKMLHGSALDVLKTLPAESVHCVITSPPYYNLRDYGVAGQIGLEHSPQEYIANLVMIFSEIFRVLRSDGTLWVNIADSYSGSGGFSPDSPSNQNSEQRKQKGAIKGKRKFEGVKRKEMLGIPWRLAFALQDSGWYLRQDIIWAKPNPMPESVKDRFTRSHEYIFLLSKKPRYFFDARAVAEDCVSLEDLKRRVENGKGEWKTKKVAEGGYAMRSVANGENRSRTELYSADGKRNKRSVWNIALKPFKDAHFATFPEDLIEPMILAGTSEKGCCGACNAPYERVFTKELVPTAKASFNSKVDERDLAADKNDQGSNRMKSGHKPGWVNATTTTGWRKTCECDCSEVVPATVLDPFGGAATTGLVALKHRRNFLGIELSSDYIEIAEKRTAEIQVNLF